MDFPVGAAGDGVEVDKDADAVVEAALYESLHRCPAVDINLGWITRIGGIVAEGGA